MKFNLPDYVLYVLNTLNNNNFSAWVVGGSVRDIFLGKSPTDYDIATDALPSQVQNLFEKTVPTGIKHGTVTVLVDKNSIEVTTYRTDGKYNDSRHPNSVRFVSNIKDDLSRRDFTVNAMAYNAKGELFDPFDAIEDIKRSLLRTVGDPNLRFNEDALRIMRLFRFSSQLKFQIEDTTFKSALNNAESIKHVSVERIREEFFKLLIGENPAVILPLLNRGALEFVGLKSQDYSFAKTVKCTSSLEARFSMFCFENNLHPDNFCKKLKTSTAFLNCTSAIFNLLSRNELPKNKYEIKLLLNEFGTDYFKLYLICAEALYDIKELQLSFNEIIHNNEPYNINMLSVNGNDILGLGANGKTVGSVLNNLLLCVIKEPTLNDKKQLINIAKEGLRNEN